MSAPTQAEEILMDLFEANSEYQKIINTLSDVPPLEWPNVEDRLIPLRKKLKLLYYQACQSGYAYTRRWRHH